MKQTKNPIKSSLDMLNRKNEGDDGSKNKINEIEDRMIEIAQSEHTERVERK